MNTENSALNTENSALKLEQMKAENSALKFKHGLDSMKTLLSLGGDNMMLQNKGSDLFHTNGNHTEATVAKPMTIDLPDLKDDVAACTARSILLEKFVDFSESLEKGIQQFRERKQGSEADVCNFVNTAVEDAIALFGHLHYGKYDPKELKAIDISMERSFLSCRPDIVVVSIHDIPILSIEVKRPLSEGHLTDYKKVLGQAFDQSEVVQAFHGPGAGLCVLSTYNESIICWPFDSNIDKELGFLDDMPVFAPVEKGQQRTAALKGIRPVLEKLASRGFKYADDDIRWRHVGRYKEHFVLFDLADLKEIKSDIKEDIVVNVVNKHISELEKRNEAGSVPTQGFAGELDIMMGASHSHEFESLPEG